MKPPEEGSSEQTKRNIISKITIPLFLRPLAEWFSRYPFLLFIAIIVVAVLFGNGLDLGLPYLFWHEKWYIQFLSGLAVASLFNELSFVGYLLDSDEKWMKVENEKSRSLNWYYVRTLVVLGFVALLSTFFYTKNFHPSIRFPFVSALLLGISAFWALTNWLSKHLPLFWGLKWIPKRRKLEEKKEEIVKLHTLAGFYFYTFTFLFAVLSICFVDSIYLSPAVGVCILLGLAARSYGFVLYYSESHYSGIFLLLAIFLLAISLIPARNHQFDGLSLQNRITLPRTPEELGNQTNLLNNDETLKNWSAEIGENRKLVVVAVSGGGIRAATWAVSVLTKLENEIPELPKHIRIINGASGGVLGAAYYTADLRNRQKNGSRMDEKHRNNLIDAISKDSLSPSVRYLVLRDLPLLPVAWLPLKDRGQAIEDAWKKNTNNVLAERLAALRDDEKIGKIPSLIFSPMLVEDGRRLLISNLDLSQLLIRNSGPIIGSESEKTYSISAMEFYRVLPSYDQLKLSTAARMSATFPYISPASELPTTPPRHLVDAGYYDNYGINVTALWLIRTLSLKNYAKGVVLIQIRDGLEDIKRAQYYKDKKEHGPILPWLTTPVIALLNSQEATMSYRNDEVISELAKLLNKEDPGYFTNIIFEFTKTASLSWYLTQNEITELKNDMESSDRKKQIDNLRKELAE